MRFALVAALMVLGTVPYVSAEEPTEGDCDSTGRLVCAGADAGGNVTCFFATPTSVQCDWTRGILWSGFSPVALPGKVEGSSTRFLETCINTSCTTDSETRTLATCTWLPASECVDGESDGGTVGPIELAMGQCLKVTAGEAITVHAEVLDQAIVLATADFSNDGEGAGQECLVDDGR